MNKEIEIPEGYEARIEGNKVILEQKVSEDEKTRKGLWKYFHDWQYSPLCHTIKDKIREYVANHFIADTVVKTDMKDIVKAMEEGVRLGMEEQKPEEKISVSEELYEHIRNACACIEDAMSSDTMRDMTDYLEMADSSAQKAFDMVEKSVIKQPAEWSEKDEDMLNSIISTCQLAAQDRNSEPARHLFEMQERFLKSLHPQLKHCGNTYYDIIHNILDSLKDMDFMKITPEHRVSLLNDIRVKCKDADECAAILDEPHWKPSEE